MATRFYWTLLLTVPGWFREEFGREMTTVFRDTLRDAQRDGGTAVAALVVKTTGEVLALAARLHFDALRQDSSYALRTLRRTPASTAAVITTLAIGMGPTLVVANLLQQVVIRPLPFPEPDRLVSMWNAQPGKNAREFPLSMPDFIDFRDGQSDFEALAAHAGTSVAFVAGSEPRQVPGVLTTSELFHVLRVTPVIGRPLNRADSAPGAPAVVVLGNDFWRSEFGGRLDVVGTMVSIDGRQTEIVGVLPPLDFPNGSRNYWVPLTVDPAGGNRGSHFLSATGRLTSARSIPQATDVLNGIARSLAERFPSTNAGNLVELIPLKDQLNGDAPRLIAVLGVAIAAVLLIACTNVAGLLSVRSSLRHTELAVRTAVGASLRRLRRQLFIEHLFVAGIGAVGATLLAVPMHRLLVEQRLLSLPRTTGGTIGWPAFALLVVVVVAVGIALARVSARRPALTGNAAALLAGARQTSHRGQLRMRRALVVAQVAGALALVVVAGLMIRSAARLAAVDPGFRTENVLTFGMVLPASAYPDPPARQRFVERVLEQVRTIPGVEAAASAGYAPMGQMRATRRFAPTDRPMPPAGSETLALDMPVGPGYFEVMGVPLVEGRTFTARDSAEGTPVIIVSQTFAREVFPGQSAIGKQIGFYASRPGAAPPPTREIVGVVGDVRQDGVSRQPIAHMYTPYAQTAWGFTSFFLRVGGDPAAVSGMLQRAVSRVDPMRPVRDVKSTADIVSESLARQRAMTWMLGALAAIALVLATVGLYGVSATAATARSRELAIRAAIGAEPPALMRLMLTHGVVTGLIGVAIGAVVSLAATTGLGALLYETAPRDPAIFAATAALLLTTAMLATYLPARRALKMNPAEVLRSE
jgi:putative ABC transport system permease protein